MRVFHFRKKEHGLLALEKQQLKISEIDELNDPFELLAADLTDEVERRKFLNWKTEISRKIGFLSFSKRMSSPLLWSHYADRHRGVALIFQVDRELVIPVSYCENRLPLNILEIMKNGGFSAELAERLGSTKSLDWSYEEELRLAVNLESCISDNGLMFEPMNDQMKLIGIVAGALAKITPQDVESRLPHGQTLDFFRARLDNKSFEVVLGEEPSIEIIGKKA